MKTVKGQLLRWICENHARDILLDRRMAREKALELAKTRGLDNFKCSNKWITNFLKEHGFSADLSNRTGPYFDNYRDWIDLMRSTIVKYKHDDLFHVDELTMYSDILPARIASPRSRVSAINRVTILMGCNSSGTTKLPLLICGPYSSRTTTKDHLYCHSEDCSISDELFTDWLLAVNDRMIERDRKILLFLPRTRAHALQDLWLRNVELVYLPDAFPAHLRPLRRDVFHYVKMIFRRRYAAARLERHTFEWNLRDVLESLIEAWERVPREIVIYSFQRTRFRTDDCFMQIDCDCWPTLNTGVSFKRFVTFDDGLSNKRVSSERNNRYHGYNLRADAKNLQIDNEGSVNLTLDQAENSDESDTENRPVSNRNSTPSSSVYQKARHISTQRRSRSPELDDSGERFDADGRKEKRMKTEHDWSKQYETTFVFGSPNANASNRKNCSSEQHRGDKNILDSYIFNATPPSASPRN